MFTKKKPHQNPSAENNFSSPKNIPRKSRESQQLFRMLNNFQNGESDSRFMIVVVLFIIMILSVLSVHLRSWSNDNQAKTNYVQTPEGITEAVHQLNSDDRTPETISRFAADVSKGCFTWNGKVDGQIDPGVLFGSDRIPTVLEKCRLAFSNQAYIFYVSDLLQRYKTNPVFEAKLAPSNFIQSASREGREVQIQVRPFTPKQIGKGKWTIEVGMTRIIKLQNMNLEEPFNHTFTLQAIPPYSDPLISNQTPLGRLLNGWTVQGLKIVDIKRN